MCGISGVRSFSPDDPIRADQIIQLLLASEHRGKDACGVALQERGSGKIQIYKDDSPAGRFVQTARFEEFLEEHLSPGTATAILHTRAATGSGVGDGGTPRKPENNHPMWKGKTAVVHNGCISNHKLLFERYKLERSCNTDSDILRAILDEGGLEPAGIKRLSDCSGGAAIAAVSEAYPDKLLLARSGSPLVIGAHNKQMVFASERGIVQAGFRQHVQKFGFWIRPLHVEAGFSPFPSDTAWLFDEKGMIGHWEFKTASYSQPIAYKWERKQTADRKISKRMARVLDLKEVMYTGFLCPNKLCPRGQPGHGMDITREMAKEFSRWYCTTCRMHLDGSGFEPEKSKEVVIQ